MNNFKWAMLSNTLIFISYSLCVTFSACYFNKPALLVWYVMLIFMGSSYKEESKNKEKNDGNDK